MPTTAQLIDAFNEFAPEHYANDWDNVGLLVGSETWEASRILLTIDLTEEVMQEAIQNKVSAIVAYHPPIFDTLSSVTDKTFKERIVLKAIEHSIAIYSPHTALDVARGGVNDWIAEGIGQGDVRAIAPFGNLPPSEQCKLVTMCPEEHVEPIRSALASVACGRIGNYEQCSFTTKGTGAFLGNEHSNPVVGEAGELEVTPECKLEMVVSTSALSLAIQTLKQFHPYEEPVVEVYQLSERPHRAIGVGRRIHLDQEVQLDELARRVKKHLNIGYIRVAPANGVGDRSIVKTIGLCAGAGGSVCQEAIAEGCEVYITGEMTHHQVVAALARGCSVILTGHTNSERGYLPTLKQLLEKHIEGASITVSSADSTLWTYF